MVSLQDAVCDFTGLIENILEETIDRSEFSDLTQKQLYYLRAIVRMKNPTVTMLAREFCLSKPTVTVLLDRLEEKGYIIRFRSDKDKRIVLIQPDKKGERINELRKIACEKISEKIRTGLSREDAMIFADLLKKISEHSG